MMRPAGIRCFGIDVPPAPPRNAGPQWISDSGCRCQDVDLIDHPLHDSTTAPRDDQIRPSIKRRRWHVSSSPWTDTIPTPTSTVQRPEPEIDKMAEPAEPRHEDAKPPALVKFENLMDLGRWHLACGELESATRAFTTAMQLCKAHMILASQEYKILGNFGWLSRLQGRYTQAADTLQEAIALADAVPGPPDPERVMMAGELGTIYRQMDRHDDACRAFTEQLGMAEQLGLERAVCRSIGNLGMTNYQRGLQLWEQHPEDPVSKQQASDLVKLAIVQIKKRVALAQKIQKQESPWEGHGTNIRHRQAITWQSVGHGRLSLCYTALSDLGLPSDRPALLEAAESAAKQAVIVAEEYNTGALPMARFFYARVLLLLGQRDLALVQLNPPPQEAGWSVDPPAIALCREPSAEHRGYLAEIVAAGADLEAMDSLGYTALDHAVYGGDAGSIEILLEGLRAQYRRLDEEKGAESLDVERKVSERLVEAKLRKGYREILQGKIRPLLDTVTGPEQSVEVMRALRRAYAEALSSNEEMAGMFDRLRYLRYHDFTAFGRLPRSSDGLVKEYNPEDDECGFLLFFSYRWINTDRTRNTPDDEKHTQYRRMLDAAEEFLKQNPEVDRETLGIWMVSCCAPSADVLAMLILAPQDFACVDQDNPGSGVSALPIIIAQCDAVISLLDNDYFDRAWCCVEAMMIQAMRSWRYLHQWYQHLEPVGGVGSGVLTNKSPVYLDMKNKKLTYETDRPKVLFLERQTKLLSQYY